jgi:hypothetical protein
MGVVVAALLTLALPACGDDDDGAARDASTTTGESSGDDGAGGSDDGLPADAARQLAANIQQASGGRITDEQAECIADEFLESADLRGIAEQIAQGSDPRTDPALQSQLVSALLECVPADVLAELTSTSSTTG